MLKSYINDEWTLIDALGYENLIKQILSIIKNATPPFTVAVYGGWGTGKTSIMKQLFFRVGGQISSVLLPFSESPDKEQLEKETLNKIEELRKEYGSEHVAIWFNPWEHQFEDEPIIGLLHEIREKFNLFSKVEEEAKKLAEVTVRSGLDILTSIINNLKKIKIEPGKIEKYGERYESEHFEIRSSSQRFRLLFEKAIGKLIGKEHKALVIFIDDLDRCTDENVIKLIEGIKLYLSTSNCIFVFGMDQFNVLRTLEKYSIHKDYLDKLFQCVSRIPLSKNYEEFIYGIINEYFEDIESDTLAKVLSDILEKNPRKVKNFLNSFRAYWEMQKQNEDESKAKGLKIEIFALFHLLRIYFEPIFTILERNPIYIRNLANVCKNNSPDRKVEHMFQKYLKNPIAEEITSDTESESEIITPAKLEKEELDYMEDISFKYEALERFKEHFVRYYESDLQHLAPQSISMYLGVIEGDLK